MRYARGLRAFSVAGVVAVQAGLAHAAPEAGWWWNPNESGRGFFVESQNGIIYLAGYLYESDGRATWLVAGGPNADPYTYSGRLLAYGKGQTLFGDYQPPAAPTDAGAVALSFTDDTHGTLTWPGGTIAIERQRFGATGAVFQPDSGWWWNADESGRGYSVEVQGESLFVVAFMYDDAGNPVWHYSAGRMATPTTYQGPWLQFAGGQTMTGAYHPPGVPTPIGQLGVEFTALDEATLTIDAPAASDAMDAEKGRPLRFFVPIKREFKPKATYVLPARYDGKFSQKVVSKFVTSGITSDTTATVSGDLTWAIDPNFGTLTLRQPGNRYTLAVTGGLKPIHLTYAVTQDGAATHCTGNLSAAYELTDTGSYLDVNVFAQYVGQIRTTVFDTLVLTCIHKDGSPTDIQPLFVGIPVTLDIKGVVSYGITGVKDPYHPIPEQTVSGDWSFIVLP